LVPPTVVYGVIAVALHVAVGVGVLEDPPPPHADSAMSTAVAVR
jgi:hypothetical protein